MDHQYTIDDRIFEVSLLSGIEGARDIEGCGVYLIGGGAIQFYAHDPALRRPTLDCDLQGTCIFPKSLRKKWGTAALERLRSRGFSGVYKHARTGAEVKLGTSSGEQPFFLHLDAYTPHYFAEHQREIMEAYERRMPLNLEGGMANIFYDVQSPEDLLSYKLRRPLVGVKMGRLCPEDEEIINTIAAGGIDDVEVGDLEERLNDTLALRGMGMEEITRNGHLEATQLLDKYKDQKDIYDILLLIESDRKNKLFGDKQIIKESVERYLPYLPAPSQYHSP